MISQVDLVKTQLFDYLREVEQVGCGGRMDERKDVCCEIHLSSFRLVESLSGFCTVQRTAVRMRLTFAG